MKENLSNLFNDIQTVWNFSFVLASSNDALSLASEYFYGSGTENDLEN